MDHICTSRIVAPVYRDHIRTSRIVALSVQGSIICTNGTQAPVYRDHLTDTHQRDTGSCVQGSFNRHAPMGHRLLCTGIA